MYNEGCLIEVDKNIYLIYHQTAIFIPETLFFELFITKNVIKYQDKHILNNYPFKDYLSSDAILVKDEYMNQIYIYDQGNFYNCEEDMVKKSGLRFLDESAILTIKKIKKKSKKNYE